MGILDYARDRRGKIPRWILAIGGGALGVIGLLWASTVYYVAEDSEVCQECGAHLMEKHWLNGAAWTTSTETPSAVSQVLAAHGVGIGHTHRWEKFAQRKLAVCARIYACSFGARPAVASNSNFMGGFLDNLYAYGNPATADLWRRRMLDLSTAEATEHAFDRMGGDLMIDSVDRFKTKAEFDRWWAKAGPAMETGFAAASK